MIDEKKLIEWAELVRDDYKKCPDDCYEADVVQYIIDGIIKQPKVDVPDTNVGRWIPIKFRETTDEDGFDKEEHPIMLDCPLPDNGEEVLVTTKSGHVVEDTFYDDDGAYLECYEWDEITAWMPLPEPYKESE